ncbi:DNA-protecting protein DprA [Exilibacterium tricleocarpae]|uniref:DNA-protecting protein DprA n=1 Tax=Exilibacterium tricleocarpae TaxID=2591008 RepID=A0A545T0F6_9GAMM|nr:DNA-processing protein DprA [Exilibacterium tricleocarpae]TQV70690.1 DNA-protecting protein DprA [Exilibacterium tricleocarpae]
MDIVTRAALTLLRLPQVGSARYWQLVERFGSPVAVLEAPSAALEPLVGAAALAQLAAYKRCAASSELGARVDRDLAKIGRLDATVLTAHSTQYPPLLREIHRPPPVLYVKGDVGCLALPQLAVVGSRSPSPGGVDNAREFARYLAASGFAITSGLALGVDAAAHAGALAAAGTTLAVLGTGIDLVYPRRHRTLAESIIDHGGALVSEFPPGTPPDAANFPRRNRIISGLSLGVLVVEATVKSGSLITARLGLQQNREVFAIPGSIHNPASRGCHALIRDGATLVEQATDIVEHLRGLLAFQQQQVPPSVTASMVEEPTAQAHTVLRAMGFDPVTVDDLAARTGMSASEVTANLLSLELEGYIEQTVLGYQRSR